MNYDDDVDVSDDDWVNDAEPDWELVAADRAGRWADAEEAVMARGGFYHEGGN